MKKGLTHFVVVAFIVGLLLLNRPAHPSFAYPVTNERNSGETPLAINIEERQAPTLAPSGNLEMTNQLVELFKEVPLEAERLSTEQQYLLSVLTDQPTTKRVTIVETNQVNLSHTRFIKLELFSVDITFSREKMEQRSRNIFIWYGSSQEGSDNIILVANGINITGNVLAGNVLYAIRPLGDGLHAIVQVDQGKYPPDHPPEFESTQEAQTQSSLSLTEKSPADDDGSVIRVLVAYTSAAANSAGDIVSLIWLAAAETNQSYLNSQIDTEVQIADYMLVNYTESGNHSTDLDRFRTPDDGFMDDAHDVRDDTAADVAILLIDNGSFCGLASEIMADAVTAFATVHYSCATGNYSFAHEIGHLQGARHNPEADPNNLPFPYGHGYRYIEGGWRTIMSVLDCPFPCTTRIQYWSNPNVFYGGVPIGTPETHDNARVLNETAYTVANFRVGDDPPPPPPSPECLPPESGDWVITESCTLESSDSVQADLIVENGAILTIDDGVSLDIDFINHQLYVVNGSGIFIKNSGKIY